MDPSIPYDEPSKYRAERPYTAPSQAIPYFDPNLVSKRVKRWVQQRSDREKELKEHIFYDQS